MAANGDPDIWRNVGTVSGDGWVLTTTVGTATTTTTWPIGAGSSVWTTSTGGGDWMAHPMTADEIIDQGARELARKRPA